MREAYKMFVWHRWDDNIRMDFREVGWEIVGWMQLAQDRAQWKALAKVITNLQFPQNVGNFLTSSVTVSFSRRTMFHGVN
jgi:hypothetical protein